MHGCFAGVSAPAKHTHLLTIWVATGDPIGRSICQCFSALLANGHNRTPFEAKPVDGPDHKENEERELEDRYSADHIQYRDSAPGSKDRIERRVGVDAPQAAK